jgi:hypothetical protein
MSTLTIPTQRYSPEPDVDGRFDALVRAVPAQRVAQGRNRVDFETVFDLDYCQPIEEVPATGFAPLVAQPRARRIRVDAPDLVPQVAPRVTSRAVAQRRNGVRLTRRGRAVLVLAFLALALGAMTLMGGWATATLTDGPAEQVRIVEVQPGDTLYGIAGDLAEPGEIRAMVHRIQELNSLPGSGLSEGQKLAVPRG